MPSKKKVGGGGGRGRPKKPKKTKNKTIKKKKPKKKSKKKCYGGKKNKTKKSQQLPAAMATVSPVKRSKKSGVGRPKKKRVTKGKPRTWNGSSTTAAARRPTAVMGRIYFGGGGGRFGGGFVAQEVGGGANTIVRRVRTSCNPFSSSVLRSTNQIPVNYGVRSYRGIKGGGIGAVFSTIVRTLVPIFKGLFRVGSSMAKSPVGQIVKQEAIRSGLNAGIGVVGDALRGRNVAQSAKARVKEQARKLPGNIQRAVSRPTPTRAAKTPSVNTTRPPSSSAARGKNVRVATAKRQAPKLKTSGLKFSKMKTSGLKLSKLAKKTRDLFSNN